MTSLEPGSEIAGYRIESLIGRGGMAVVYRAEDTRLGRKVALKLLTPQFADSEQFRQRFIRESRLAASLDHPNIVPIYEAGDAGGELFIAMRYVLGSDLKVVLAAEGGRLPVDQILRLFVQVGDALDTAHHAGLVHRDVKPGNVLVDSRRGGPEHAYLTDFGIARAMLSAGTLTVAGQFLGTPDYAAPEQVNGHPVDGRADQYALACVAFEMLGGTVPFKRELPIATLYAHLSTPPPSLTAARPDLPPAVDDVLGRAMAKDPGERYPTCADFADALREALGLDPYDPSRAAPTPTLPMTAFESPVPAGQASAAQVPPAQVPRPSEPVSVTWTAVVTVDREYYDRIQAVNDSDTESISFPGHVPERRIPLLGTEVLIGRYSKSKGIDPEIDLGGDPRDPGVSRQHAKLVPAPDGTWTVVDLSTENGITVNGRDVPSGDSVPLRAGDRIHLGAWTRITITRA
jgi:serine/threonine protein kinase